MDKNISENNKLIKNDNFYQILNYFITLSTWEYFLLLNKYSYNIYF